MQTTVQMKKVLIISTAALFTLAACQSAPKADEAKTNEEQVVSATEGVAYKVDSNQVVQFIGTKPVGQHNGTFKISEGSLFVKNDTDVTGGKLVLDITSLNITDADTSGITKLKQHLSSADFFEATKFPTATFEITSVQPFVQDSAKATLVLDGATHTVNGNLTLKGVTKNVSFPAVINVNKDVVSAKANFNINRTDWGLVYGNDKSLGDKFIRPEVNISFSIAAHK